MSKTKLFKQPDSWLAIPEQRSINLQQWTLVVEFEVYDSRELQGIYGYSYVVHDVIKDEPCWVTYDTYEEALLSAVRKMAKKQTEKPYFYGDVVILGLPEETTLDICDSPQTYRPHTTLAEMADRASRELEKAIAYYQNDVVLSPEHNTPWEQR